MERADEFTKGVVESKSQNTLEGKNSIIGIVGAGIVSFPYAFMSTGIVSGFILILIFFLISILTLRILFMSIHYAPKVVHSYEELSEVYFGKIVKKVNEVVMFLTLCAPLITFFCIIGDSICPILQHFLGEESYLASREFVIGTFAIAIIYPLTLFRSLYALRFTSVLGVLSVCYLIGMVPVLSIINMAEGKVPKEIEGKSVLNTGRFLGICPEFIMAVPIYAFSFCCHIVCVPIHNELKNTSLRKLDIITVITYVFVLFGYSVVGFFGFFNFGDDTAPDILLSYDATSIEASIGRICIAVCSTFHYPIVASVQRASVSSVFFPGQKTDTFSHVVMSSLLFIGNLILALLLPDITNVLGFTASVGVVLLTYGFPGLFAWKLARRDDISVLAKIWWYSWSVVLIILSIVMIIVGPTTTIFKIIAERQTVEN